MTDKPQLKKADSEELRLFYDWMKEQFHPGELKWLSHIENMCDCGVYCAYGLWRNGELIAYALLGNTKDQRVHLLDYFAVLPQYQDAGWGSRCLQMLSEELPGDAILLEVEDPDYAPDEEERAHFQRRIRFYDRNGCEHMKVKLNLYGFDYAIMQLPQRKHLSDAQAHEALMEIYHTFSPPDMYAKHVKFREDSYA